MIGEKEIESKEPSGICYDKSDKTYYVVSDKGSIVHFDADFKVLNKESFKGEDFEAVCINNNLLVISNESARKIYMINKRNLKKIKTIHLNLKGELNKGVEALTYIPELNQYVLLTEAPPIKLLLLNDQFLEVKQLTFSGLSDVSDVTYYNNHLYILSDEDEKILKMNLNLSIVQEFSVPVTNPEGLCFDDKKLIIASDKLHKLYFFDKI